MERTQGVERKDPLRDEWDAAAFGPLFFDQSSADHDERPTKTGPQAGFRHVVICLVSALEVLKLVGLAVPFLGLGQRVLLFADIGPDFGQLGVELDEGLLIVG